MRCICYIADSLMLSPQGKCLSVSLFDLIFGEQQEEKDPETVIDEINSELARLGGVEIGN